MTIDEHGSAGGDRRISPADVHSVTFSRSAMLRAGYNDTEVDRFLDRVGEELARLHAEKAELRDQIHALQAQVEGEESHDAPSAAAVGILAAAQQTADQYVAEAEDFSRVMTSEAREQYEEQLRTAREQAGAIIQAAQAAASSIAADADPAAAANRPDPAELQRQVVYLQAFAQACRVQLRSYLESLLSDVEAEWGRADPAALPAAPPGTPPHVERGAALPAPATSDAAGGVPAPDTPDHGHAPNVVSEVLRPGR